MRSDPHSPLVPARVRALVIPLGKIKRSRFLKFYNQLTKYNAVALRDLPEEQESISNGIRHGSRRLGMIVYDYTLSGLPEAHGGLIPFELYRESLVVIGIGDAREYDATAEYSNGDAVDWRRTQFLDLANDLHEQYPRALIQRVLLFGEPGIETEEVINDEFVLLPDSEVEREAGLPRVVHSMTLGLRREMYNYSKSIQTLPSIASPSLPDFQPIQPAWHSLDSPTMSRRDSSFSQTSNTSTVADNISSHRMSLPILSSHNSSETTLHSDANKRTPAKTFDEITSGEPTALSSNPLNRLRPRPATIIASRSDSQDKVSVSGFGSDSFSEKTRHKGLGRIGVVNCGLLLLSGRWDDALKEAVDCAIKARSFSDHIWFAKALELVAISMVLLAWTGLEFQIPSICYTTTDQSASGKAPVSPNLDTRHDLVLQPATTPVAKATFMKMITSVMPGMTHMIQSIYGRPNSSGAGGAIPQFVASECAIRMSKLLTVMNQSGGTLTDDDIAYFMLGHPRNTAPKNSVSRLRMHPSRRDITNVLSRALPDLYENSALMPSDHAIVLAGVSAVYSLLGMQRKRGMMMKELLSILLPVLQQAKVAGAAEAGIHPSASVSALALATNSTGWEFETGIGSYLNAVCQAYDIPVYDWSEQVGSELLQGQDHQNEADRSCANQLVGNFVLHAQGGMSVKAEVLRICIQVCEALSDAAGVIHYSAALLRTAGPGIAPAAGAVDTLVTLAREEQIQLANTIFKSAETTTDGEKQPEVDYWDEFIVRGFYLLEPAGGSGLQMRKKSELRKVQAKSNQPRDPFIHNPFLDKASTAAADNMLCANEQNEFVVVLQNPYEFEVHVESIKLVADESNIDIHKTDITLKPCRTQSFSLSGRIYAEGALNISACIIKIKGCRIRRFPIFSNPWTPETDIKVKNLGFRSANKTSARDSDLSQRFSWNESQTPDFPVPTSVALKVIPEQPNLIVQTSSVPQNSLMLLEGESKTVTITIHNDSPVPADFMLISIGDTATEAMQEAISEKGIHPAEMYEIEYQMSRLPVLTLTPDQPSSIAAQSSATFTFEIVAKAGLSSAYLQFDYAYLSAASTAGADSFYTKKLRYTLDVTVNASILLHRLEIVSLPGDFIGQLKSLAEHSGTAEKSDTGLFKQVASALANSTDTDDHCLMLLDLRNSWPSPLNIDLQYTRDEAVSDDSPMSATDATDFKSNAQIQPGQILRQILLIPKIYLANPHKRIKPLSPAHQRQFIVSTDKLTPEVELRSRECFWFREALLQHLVGTWTLSDSFVERTGNIDLRAMRLSARMLDHLRISDLKFDITAHGSQVQQSSRTTFEADVDDFFTVRTTLKNKSSQTIYPLLRLRPSLADQVREVALDLSKRFAWSGVLQRPLPPLRPNTEFSVDLPVRALACGDYTVGASVEEIIVAEDAPTATKAAGGAEQADADLDDFVRDVGRRTWTATSPCIIRVRDAKEDSAMM